MRSDSDSLTVPGLALRRCHSLPVAAAGAAPSQTSVPSPLLPASDCRVPPSPAPHTAAQSACAHQRDSGRVPSSFTRCAPRAMLPFCEIAYTGRSRRPADPSARSETASTTRSRISAPPAFELACLGPGLCRGHSSAFSASVFSSRPSRLAPAVVAMSLRGIPGRARAAPDVARCVFSRSYTRIPLKALRTPQDAQKRLVRDVPAVSRRVDQNCAVGDSFWAEVRSSPAALLLLASRDRHRSHPRHICIDLGHPRPILRLRDWPF